MAYTFLGGDLNPFSRTNKAVVNILLCCTIVWLLLTAISLTPINQWLFYQLAFTPSFPNFFYQPWSIFTYIFMHYDFFHLFSNMLWLFFIGILLEDLTGKRYIWKLFIGGGIFGAVFYSIIFNLFLNTQHVHPHMVGASAGVSAIIIATAVFSPRYQVWIFGILPVELIWIAVLRVIFDIFGAVGPLNQGGFLSHIGGEIFGLLFVLHSRGNIHIPLIDSIANFFTSLFSPKPKSTFKPARKIEVTINKNYNSTNKTVSQEEIDRILDKINQSGYESLTKTEKETLFRAGDK
jgi:membrane associated rhomboid family serine protease